MNARLFLAAISVGSPLMTLAATPVLVDTNGISVGIPIRTVGSDPTQVTVVTRSGFVVNYDSLTGEVAFNVQDAVGNKIHANEAFYESTDCTGKGYLPAAATPASLAGGVVVRADPTFWGAVLVQIPKNAPATIRTLRSSRFSGSACQDRSAFPFIAAAVVPLANSPAVTAVNGTLNLPLRLEIVSDCVFSSGFQCANP